MASRAQEIQRATKRARKNFSAYTVAQDRRLFDIYDDAIRTLTARLHTYSTQGVIAPARLGLMLRQVEEQVKLLRPQLRRELLKGINNAVDFGIESGLMGADAALVRSRKKAMLGTSFFGRDGKLRKFDPKVELYAESKWATVNREAVDAMLKYQPRGLTLSKRVWDVSWQTERALRTQISTGIMLGEGPAKISRRIRGNLGLPDTFRGTVRRDFKPGTGIYRSAYKNALRVARTETARAYAEGQYRYGRTKKWIVGYISRVGSGNPAPYDASVDGQFFPKDTPPDIPYHPNCMCYPETVTTEQPWQGYERGQSQAEFDKKRET